MFQRSIHSCHKKGALRSPLVMAELLQGLRSIQGEREKVKIKRKMVRYRLLKGEVVARLRIEASK